jgi:3-hydroxyisobutyrate dehydrogenase-like beta-hydroxyacid dehydrogenase
MKNSKEHISIIGLGAMGFALADTFIKEGYTTTLWNRTSAKAEPLRSLGARLAKSVNEAVEASDLIIACVLNYEVLFELLEQLKTITLGKTLVNLTNGTPEEAQQVANWAKENNIDYLDGGIMAVPTMIGLTESLVLYSGSQKAFEKYKADLERLGRAQFLGTDPALAPLYDLSLLSGMYGVFSGFLHATALVQTTSINVAEFTTDYLIPWLKAMTNLLEELSVQIETKNYETKGSNLSMQIIGVENIIKAGKSRGIPSDFIEPFYRFAKKREAVGDKNDDISSLIEVIK